MRRIAPLLSLLACACLEAPDYTGRTCDTTRPCPEGYVCASDQRCALGFEDAAIVQPLDARVDLGFVDATPADVSDATVMMMDAEPLDDGVFVPDAVTPDQGFLDAEDPVLARCRDATMYPATGWEVRHFMLNAGDTFGACVGVEDLPGDRIDRDYVANGPLPGVVERFGSRYTARRTFGAGVVTLVVTHDDGMRILIDNNVVYERWQNGVEYDVVVRTPYLTAGEHQIAIEHYENQGFSQIRYEATPGCQRLDAPASAWTVAYYRLGAGGTIDQSECFGVETVQGLTIAQNFAASAPAPVLAAGVSDNFAAVARGTRNIGGVTRFTFAHDDGLRVTIGGTRIYDGWSTGPRTGQTVDIYGAGANEILIEAHELTGDASYSVSWTSVCAIQTAPSATSWRVRYYPAIQSGGAFALDRTICLGAETIAGEQLSIEWQGGAAAPPNALGITEMWGAEYTGPRTFAANTTINLHHDDGLRVYVDNSRLYDSWTAPQVINSSMIMPSGTHDLRLEYFEWQGGAGIGFTW